MRSTWRKASTARHNARLKKKPFETVGEIAKLYRDRVAVLFDDNGRLACAFQVTGDDVAEFDGPTLVQVPAKLTLRKVRA